MKTHLDKTKVKRILIISLSNIGDVILTLPVVQVMNELFPHSSIDVVIGPKAKALLEIDSRISNVIVYNKHISVGGKISFVKELRSRKYDLCVDLKHTLIPFFLGAKCKTGFIARKRRPGVHMKDYHLMVLKSIAPALDQLSYIPELCINEKSEAQLVKQLFSLGVDVNDEYIVINPGAHSPNKRWPEKKFIELIECFTEKNDIIIILMGDKLEKEICLRISAALKNKDKILDLSGKTNLAQLAVLEKWAKVVLSHDSAPMHIASALNTPCLALFGATDPEKNAPLRESDRVIVKECVCSPCEKALCGHEMECMDEIEVQEVLIALEQMLKREQ